jgi:hypothetical protein
MTISQSICSSFKLELLQGVHDFVNDTFKLALYTSGASLNALTITYSSPGEVVASGYTAGGVTLTQTTPLVLGTTALCSFANASVTAEIVARGGLIYNSSKANRAVAVLDFGGDRRSASGVFSIQFPAADAGSAIIRIG